MKPLCVCVSVLIPYWPLNLFISHNHNHNLCNSKNPHLSFYFVLFSLYFPDSPVSPELSLLVSEE